MAGRQSSISRRRVLGAAAAIPFLPLAPVRAEPVEASSCHRDREPWDRNLGRYRALAAGAKRAAETGWFRAANDLYYRKCEDPEADHDAAFDRLDRAEDLYWRRCTEPLHEAAVAVLLTPAPDLEALRTKLAIIRAHQLQEDEASMGRDCLEVLGEDVERLSAVLRSS